MSESTSVSVVLLSFNRPALLAEALASVARQTRPPDEVIVIDNRSPKSDEIARVVAQFPAFRLIANPDNRGFTGGMNAGLAAASGEHVAFTEDDIVWAPDYLEGLVDVSMETPDAGILSGLQYNRTAGTMRCAGGRFTCGRVFRMEIFYGGEPGTSWTEPYEVGFVPGSMIFARAALMRRLGGFRPDFFMYGEDVEICLRVRRLGLKILVVPTVRAEHFEPPGPGPEVHPGWLEEIKIRNRAATYVLHAPWPTLLAYAAQDGAWGIPRALPVHPTLAWQRLKAWSRIGVQVPGLLADRRAFSAQVARAKAGAG